MLCVCYFILNISNMYRQNSSLSSSYLGSQCKFGQPCLLSQSIKVCHANFIESNELRNALVFFQTNPSSNSYQSVLPSRQIKSPQSIRCLCDNIYPYFNTIQDYKAFRLERLSKIQKQFQLNSSTSDTQPLNHQNNEVLNQDSQISTWETRQRNSRNSSSLIGSVQFYNQQKYEQKSPQIVLKASQTLPKKQNEISFSQFQYYLEKAFKQNNPIFLALLSLVQNEVLLSISKYDQNNHIPDNKKHSQCHKKLRWVIIELQEQLNEYLKSNHQEYLQLLKLQDISSISDDQIEKQKLKSTLKYIELLTQQDVDYLQAKQRNEVFVRSNLLSQDKIAEKQQPDKHQMYFNDLNGIKQLRENLFNQLKHFDENSNCKRMFRDLELANCGSPRKNQQKLITKFPGLSDGNKLLLKILKQFNRLDVLMTTFRDLLNQDKTAKQRKKMT